NLLRNSSEAMPKGGSIQFELRNTPEEALLIFTDNGPGLGGFGAVWRDGWRMESSKAEGRGIGLRLANRWVKSWGGRLEAKTLRSGLWGKPKGTEVRMALPKV
ncbi:MAG: sensor histidine kinase, partial [Candidatus Omnitrophica bacterium]|nr:sensor histidine kinase [Candidatus Omnitrophota bacterium]